MNETKTKSSSVPSDVEITGSINGTVKDAAGAAVKGATVTITDSDKKVVVRTISTNDDGEFSAPLLPVAFYDITVEAPNFKKHIETRVKVNVNERRAVNLDPNCGWARGKADVLYVADAFEVMATNTLTDQSFVASPIAVGNDLFLRSRTHLFRIAQ